MKRFFGPFIIAIALVSFFCYRSDGFFLSRIRGPLVEGTSVSPDDNSSKILQQPFYYLAKGRQCFVFESADGQTVVKFLNYSRFSLPRWLKAFPLPHYWKMWLLGLDEKRRLRFESTIDSFEIAMQQLQHETGLIYLHLQRGDGLPILQVTDRANRNHRIDLNQTIFVLQKKATPIYDELENRYRTGGQASLEDGVGQFLSFLQKRCALHLADDDRDVQINFGFYNGEILLLDPGRLFHDPTLSRRDRFEREITVASKRLRQWLLQKHPESVAFIDQEISQAIRSFRAY